MNSHIKKSIVLLSLMLLAMAFVAVSAASAPTWEMNAYVAGNAAKAPGGSAYSGYGFAYPYANYTSVMPIYDTVFANSRGNSSINITTSSGFVALDTSYWNGDNGTGIFNFTLPVGTYDLIITISSEYYGTSTRLMYSVEVLTAAQYINYATQKVTPRVVNHVSNNQAVGSALEGMGFAVLFGTPFAYWGWNRWREGKGAQDATGGWADRFGRGEK